MHTHTQIKINLGVWRDGSAVVTDLPEDLNLSSQVTQLPVTLALKGPMSSPGLFRHIVTHTWMDTQTHTHTNKS